MLGKDGRIYDRHFDYDRDDKLNGFEREMMDDIVFGSRMVDDIEDDIEEELEDAGLDIDELAEMDEDERREAIEDAGLDPDYYDDEF